MFLSWAFFTVFLPRFADIYGRKPIYMAAVVTSSVTFAITFFIRDPYHMIILFFFNGMWASVLFAVGLLLLYESVPNNKLAMTGTLYTVIDVSTFLYAVIYFSQICTDWLYLGLLGFVVQIFS